MNSLLQIETSPAIPLVSKVPTIILGMDVSHGSPGHYDVPSIAAVVTSREWPLISKYRASVRTQSPKMEMIDSLFKSREAEDDGLIRECLIDFYTSSGKRKPDHVIIFSDKDADHDNIGWDSSEKLMVDRPPMANRINWLRYKDKLQVGDKIRSRKLKSSCRPKTMEIPDGTVVGVDDDGGRDAYVLVRVHGLHGALKVRCSTVERVSYVLAAGDWEAFPSMFVRRHSAYLSIVLEHLAIKQ